MIRRQRLEYRLLWRYRPARFRDAHDVRFFVDATLLKPAEMLRTWKMLPGRQANRTTSPIVAIHIVRDVATHFARNRANFPETGSFLTIHLATQMGRFWRARIRAHISSLKTSATWIHLNGVSPRYAFQSLLDPVFRPSDICTDFSDLRGIAGRRVGQMHKTALGEKPKLSTRVDTLSSAWICVHAPLDRITEEALYGDEGYAGRVLPGELDVRTMYAPSLEMHDALVTCLFMPRVRRRDAVQDETREPSIDLDELYVH